MTQVRSIFPNPRLAGPEGLVALGGTLEPEILLEAYRSGIFPWPHEGYPLAWFCPDPRAVLFFEEVHIPRSLAKEQRRRLSPPRGDAPWRVTLNQNFSGVIHGCAEVPRYSQSDPQATWITPEMLAAYQKLHAHGHALSVEVWEGQELIGGIYGVGVDGIFSAESMFHKKTSASKLALLFLVEHLKSRGLAWMDIQMMTPHLKSLGAREIPRDDYLELVSVARSRVEPGFEDDGSRGVKSN